MNDLQKKTAQSIVNIFETGRIHGDYGSVAVLKGDSGHLTYGRSQTTLASGNLFLLIKAYWLDANLELQQLLRDAGRNDQAMRLEQDRFFDANYFNPALKAAQAKGIGSALGQTVVYDSFIQGGFGKVTALVGASIGADGIDEQQWIQKYVAARKNWLLGLKPPLPDTVYRMNSFAQLIEEGAWELPLPLKVRGCLISEETLEDQAPVLRVSAVDPAEQPALALYLTTPYLKGPEVRQVQEALNAHGFPNAGDGVFGPFTEALVKQFQVSRDLKADGVIGPATRAALGI